MTEVSTFFLLISKEARGGVLEVEGRAQSVGRGRAMGRHEMEMYRHHDHHHNMSSFTESSTSRFLGVEWGYILF